MAGNRNIFGLATSFVQQSKFATHTRYEACKRILGTDLRYPVFDHKVLEVLILKGRRTY